MIKSKKIIELEKNFEHLSDVLKKMDLLFKLAEEWFFLSNAKQSKRYSNELLTLAKREENKIFELKAYLMIANSYTLENNENEAFKIYSRIKIDAIQEGNIALLLDINTSLANQCIRKGDYEESIKYNIKNLELSTKHDLVTNICRSNINLGVSYMNLQKLDEAKKYFLNAMKVAQENNFKDITTLITHNLADLYRNRGDFDNALNYFFRTLTYYEENYDMEGLIISLTSISEIYHELGQRENTVDFAVRAIDAAEELNSNHLLQETYDSISVLYEKMDMYKEALLYYKKMAEISIETLEEQLEECEKQLT